MSTAGGRPRTPRDFRAKPEREKLGLARDVLDKVVIDDPDKCWIAAKETNNGGYSNLHRLVASLFSDVRGKEVHHLCRTRLCVNPAHLSVVGTSEHRLLHTTGVCLNGHDQTDPANVRWAIGNRGKMQRWCRVCDRDRRRRYRRDARSARENT